MTLETSGTILHASVWRQVEDFAPDATTTLISSAVARGTPQGLISLIHAVEAGIPVPAGFSEGTPGTNKLLRDRLNLVAHFATYGGVDELTIFEKWLATIDKAQTGKCAGPVQETLDRVLRSWILIKTRVNQQPPNPAIPRILQRFGAQIDRPPRDGKGKAIDTSALEAVLANDNVDFLDIWYGDKTFDLSDPVPSIYPKDSYQQVGVLAIELSKNENGPLSACARWFLSRLANGYTKPLEQAFERGMKTLKNSTGRERPRALRSMAKVIAAGAHPAAGKTGAKAKWEELVSCRSGDYDLPFPAAVIHSCPSAVETIQAMLDVGAIEVNQQFGGTLLHFAADAGRKEIVEMLLQRGAATETPYESDGIAQHTLTDGEAKGMTADQIADAQGYRDIANMIRAMAAKHAMRRAMHRDELPNARP
jgi:hypothetical protein